MDAPDAQTVTTSRSFCRSSQFFACGPLQNDTEFVQQILIALDIAAMQLTSLVFSGSDRSSRSSTLWQVQVHLSLLTYLNSQYQFGARARACVTVSRPTRTGLSGSGREAAARGAAAASRGTSSRVALALATEHWSTGGDGERFRLHVVLTVEHEHKALMADNNGLSIQHWQMQCGREREREESPQRHRAARCKNIL